MEENEKPLEKWTDRELRQEIMKISKSLVSKIKVCETKKQIREVWDLESRMADLQQEREKRHLQAND